MSLIYDNDRNQVLMTSTYNRNQVEQDQFQMTDNNDDIDEIWSIDPSDEAARKRAKQLPIMVAKMVNIQYVSSK